MKLKIDKAGDMKRSIDGISVLVDEAEFIAGAEGLSLKATDPSQISMVEFMMNKSGFQEYKAKEGENIGLDLSYLSQILGRASATDQLEMSTNEEKTRLQLKFTGKSSKSFSMPLLDLSQSKLPNPKIEFDAELKIESSVLTDALKDAQLISNHVTLGVNPDAFYVRAESSKGNLYNETQKSEKSVKDFTAKGSAKSMFPLEYLQDMLKAAGSDTDVTLKLKNDAPLELSYMVGKASLKYFLAPRIESE